MWGLCLAELGDTLNPKPLVVAHCVSGSRGAHCLRAESSSQRPRAHGLPSSHVPGFRAARPWVVAVGATVLVRALASGAHPSQGPPGMNTTGLLGPQCGCPVGGVGCGLWPQCGRPSPGPCGQHYPSRVWTGSLRTCPHPWLILVACNTAAEAAAGFPDSEVA